MSPAASCSPSPGRCLSDRSRCKVWSARSRDALTWIANSLTRNCTCEGRNTVHSRKVRHVWKPYMKPSSIERTSRRIRLPRICQYEQSLHCRCARTSEPLSYWETSRSAHLNEHNKDFGKLYHIKSLFKCVYPVRINLKTNKRTEHEIEASGWT